MIHDGSCTSDLMTPARRAHYKFAVGPRRVFSGRTFMKILFSAARRKHRVESAIIHCKTGDVLSPKNFLDAFY